MVYVLEGLNSLVLNYCSTTVDTNATDALALSWLPAKMLVCIAWRQPQELYIPFNLYMRMHHFYC